MISLRSQRTALRITQSQLSRDSGVARQKICLYELGSVTLTADEQRRIQEALKRELERVRNINVEVEFSTQEV
jgi:transcriptional regulator with XRE-family HTH domain